jgi:Ni/Co efflux regulator RcnB
MKQLTKKITILGLIALFFIPVASIAQQRRGTHQQNNNRTHTQDRRGHVVKKQNTQPFHHKAPGGKKHFNHPNHRGPAHRWNHRPHYQSHPRYRPTPRNNYRPAPRHYYRPGPRNYYGRPPMGRPFGMRIQIFNNLDYSLNRTAFDRDRLDIAKTAILHNGANTTQVIALMRRLSFERNRLELAKFAYAYVVDPENYFQTTDALSFYSSRRELLAFIR